jgi:hypothetical protein
LPSASGAGYGRPHGSVDAIELRSLMPRALIGGPINLVSGEGVHYRIDHENGHCPESQQ